MKRRVNILSSSILSLKPLKLGLMQSLLLIKNNNDTLVALKDVILFMQKPQTTVNGLVFDNPNSSTARYMKSWLV
jgi:hypothetical protein